MNENSATRVVRRGGASSTDTPLTDANSMIMGLARAVVRRARANIDPRDVGHDTILAMLEQQQRGACEGSCIDAPAAYYSVVVRNRVRRMLRRAEHLGLVQLDEGDEAESADPNPTPEELVARRECAQSRVRALEVRLPPVDRAALRAFLEADASAAEVAHRLHTTLNNVYQMRHRILRAIGNLSDRTDALLE